MSTPVIFIHGLCVTFPGVERALRAVERAVARQAPVPGRGRELHPRSEDAVNTRNDTRGPLLLIAGGHDHTVPDA
ncbi:MAG: hypothetical protein ABI317_07685, partial [Gaiellales bacterium]